MYISIALIGVFLLSSIVTAQSFQVRDANYKSVESSTRTDAWIDELQANFDNPQWFFDNLNDTDRLKIRQALDFAIPRQEIIDSILDGHGLLLATTTVPQTDIYYNPAVVPRAFDQAQAVALLAEVFGYTYAPWDPVLEGDDNPNTTYDETLPYFRLTMTVPSTNPLRSQWAARISFSYTAIGVDVVYKQWTWNTIISRIFVNEGYKNNYDSGEGFDAQFIGWGGGLLPGDRFFFHKTALPPNGGNYQGINDPEIDALIEAQELERNETKRVELYFQQQEMFVEDVWRNILFQAVDIYAFDANLKGFNPFFGSSIQYQNITVPKVAPDENQTSLVVSRPGEFNAYNPFISNSWYDNYVLGTTNYGLMTLSTPPGDTTYAKYKLYTMFADWWNKSDDELTFFFNLKEGLKWEDDSTNLTTDDVAFSYESMINGAFPGSSGYRSQMSNQSAGGIVVHNETLIQFNLHRWDPFTELTLFGLPILKKAQLGDVKLGDWATHSTNTGAGLVSNGPYTFVSVTNQIAYLKNSTIWDSAYYNKFTEVPFMYQALQNGGYPSISNVTVVLNNQADVALTALKNGEIDFIDSNTGLASVFDDIIVGGKATFQTYVGASWQEMGLNQGSPIWGMNPVAPPVPEPEPEGETTTTTTAQPEGTPFGDVFTIAAAFVVIATVSFTLRRRRN